MGLFDWFQPKNKFPCPVCNKELVEWQSKETDCMLAHWEEGKRHPIKVDWPDNCFDKKQEFLEASTLPKEFMIYSYDCDCPYRTELACCCENGIWISSKMYTGLEEDRKLVGAETKEQYNRRMQWLNSKLYPAVLANSRLLLRCPVRHKDTILTLLSPCVSKRPIFRHSAVAG